MSNIKWTDEDMLEFGLFSDVQHAKAEWDSKVILKMYEEFTYTREALKTPAPQPKEVSKEWEIQSFVFENITRYRDEEGLYRMHPEGQPYTLNEMMGNKCPIKSVKRLSDAVIFSVGDEVGRKIASINPSDYEMVVIKEFEIKSNNLYVYSNDDIYDGLKNGYDIRCFKHFKQKIHSTAPQQTPIEEISCLSVNDVVNCHREWIGASSEYQFLNEKFVSLLTELVKSKQSNLY